MVWAVETAQWIKSLLCKNENLSSKAHNLSEKAGMVMHMCNPKIVGCVEGPQELNTSPPASVRETSLAERDRAKTNLTTGLCVLSQE